MWNCSNSGEVLDWCWSLVSKRKWKMSSGDEPLFSRTFWSSWAFFGVSKIRSAYEKSTLDAASRCSCDFLVIWSTSRIAPTKMWLKNCIELLMFEKRKPFNKKKLKFKAVVNFHAASSHSSRWKVTSRVRSFWKLASIFNQSTLTPNNQFIFNTPHVSMKKNRKKKQTKHMLRRFNGFLGSILPKTNSERPWKWM